MLCITVILRSQKKRKIQILCMISICNATFLNTSNIWSFKLKKLFNLMIAQVAIRTKKICITKRFGIDEVWNFCATVHGKNACDDINSNRRSVFTWLPTIKSVCFYIENWKECKYFLCSKQRDNKTQNRTSNNIERMFVGSRYTPFIK